VTIPPLITKNLISEEEEELVEALRKRKNKNWKKIDMKVSTKFQINPGPTDQPTDRRTKSLIEVIART